MNTTANTTARITRSVLAMLAALLCARTAPAANLLTVNPAAVAVSCNTMIGPGPAAAFVIKPVAALTGTTTIAVAPGALPAGVSVTAPTPAILNAANQAQGLVYSVSLAAGCAGAVSGASVIRFYASGAADTSVTINVSLTAKDSPLSATPVQLTCGRSTGGGSTIYTTGATQTSLVTSSVAAGTPFTIDASTIPAWLALPPTTTKSAGVKGVYLTMAPVAPCGNYQPGTANSASIHLKNPPAPDALIPVTLQILSLSPLAAAPASAALAYTRGSSTAAFADLALTASGGKPANFAVDPASLPAWLSVDAAAGATPRTLRFSTTSVAEAIAQGSYAATVRIQSPGAGDLAVPITLSVSNPPSKLTVAEGATRNLSWTAGQPLPTLAVTLASNDTPIPYTLASAGPLAPVVAPAYLKGFAYSYSTTIPVAFDAAAFQMAQAGDVLSGTLAVTWGSPASTTVITINVTVVAAAAVIFSVTPASLPSASAGDSFVIALSGTGFVADAAQPTTVGLVSGGTFVPDANLTATVINPSNIIVTITVPKIPDPLLPFAAPGGTVVLGVCNPTGVAPCTSATGTVSLLITPNPVIQAVTSAASFVQPAPPALPVVAPYDMISLFGASFCVSGGTGCTDGQVLYGATDPNTLRYPLSLTPDSEGIRRQLSVVFQTHATPPVTIAVAPLLFATNRQINLLVPSAVANYLGKNIDLVVAFGHLPAASLLTSAPYPVRVAAADPALFTIGTNGQGEGAILSSDWSLVTEGNEAALRANPADSDVVQIYLTGLGAPDSTASNASSGAGQWPADCVSTASYLSTLSAQFGGSSTLADGVRIEGSVLNANRLPPCLGAAAVLPTVTVGGQPAVVMYAGWVTGSVAGQYQINVRLPGSAAFTPPLTEAVQLPVMVTARGIASQSGVTVWVAPRLKMSAPGVLQNSAGASWPAAGSAVVAEQGTAPYRYAVTGGALPPGLSLDAAGGAISGTPSASAAKGRFTVTVTATDSSTVPLTGSVTFTIQLN